MQLTVTDKKIDAVTLHFKLHIRSRFPVLVGDLTFVFYKSRLVGPSCCFRRRSLGERQAQSK
jgi:hypothetical protein